jgi:hypothetical protein
MQSPELKSGNHTSQELINHIELTSLDNVPEAARKVFEHWSGDSDTENLLDSVMVIEYPESSTYFVTQPKKYEEKDYGYGGAEMATYIANVSRTGELIGSGELRYISEITHDMQHGFPFVGWTETQDEFKQQGYGTRRLLEMDAIARKLYDQPLRSGFSVTRYARKVWEKAIANGLAVPPSEETNSRFTFL